MSDDLTNSQIALLCDIGEFDLSKITDDQRRDLNRLIAADYVEATESLYWAYLNAYNQGPRFS